MNYFDKKTNLQIQGRRRMRGRRGRVHQDHPVVIINWNFQCHILAHSGGLLEKKTRNYQTNLILKLLGNALD